MISLEKNTLKGQGVVHVCVCFRFQKYEEKMSVNQVEKKKSLKLGVDLR